MAAPWPRVRAVEGPHRTDQQWEFELYELSTDRGELVNVAALHPDLRKHVEKIMDTSHRDQPSPKSSSSRLPGLIDGDDEESY